jgi:hypothetical protein
VISPLAVRRFAAYDTTAFKIRRPEAQEAGLLRKSGQHLIEQFHPEMKKLGQMLPGGFHLGQPEIVEMKLTNPMTPWRSAHMAPK